MELSVSPQQAQEDEQLVLESIFGDDVVVTPNQWKVWRPLDVRVRLRPLDGASRAGVEGGRREVAVTLHVACGQRYPREKPSISLEEVRGLSNEDVKALGEQLQKRAAEMVGGVMICELCEDCRQFLYDKAAPALGSFHEEMRRKREREEEEIERQRAHSELREVEEVEVERRRRREQAEWQREQGGGEGGAGGGGEKRTVQFQLEGAGGREEERVFGGHRVVPTGEQTGRRKPHSRCEEWVGVSEGERVLVSEWSFEYNQGRKGAGGPGRVGGGKQAAPDFEHFFKRVFEVEQQVSSLSSVGSLDHALVPYAWVDVQKRSLQSTHVCVRVTTAQCVRSGETSMEGGEKEAITPARCRRLAAQWVCTLRSLHDRQMWHGSVDRAAVWTLGKAAGGFRFGDWTAGRLLRQLADLFDEALGQGARKAGDDEKATRRRDLFQLGSLLDQWRGRTPDSSRDAGSCSRGQLDEFILACQSAKQVDELLDHPYLVTDFLFSESGLSPHGSQQTAAGGGAGPTAPSRLLKEFFLVSLLGKGGFGDVVLAKNKVDGNDYAVKRIPLNPKSERLNRKMTKEAKLFSRLNHPNVVRYYNAWFEDQSTRPQRVDSPKGKEQEEREREKGRSSPGDSKLLASRIRNMDVSGRRSRAGGAGSRLAGAVGSVDDDDDWVPSFSHCGDGSDDSSSSSEDEEEEEESAGDRAVTLFSRNHARPETEDSESILFERGDVSDEVARSVAGETEPSTVPPATGTETTTSTESPPTRMLYIQMEYCERGTLRACIDQGGLWQNTKQVWRMFGEILSGLEYIHGLEMIHRDIKPMNILLDAGEHVKIGDFGLATRELLRRQPVGGGPAGGGGGVTGAGDSLVASAGTGQAGGGGGGGSGQTRDIGTELYMAPELFQLQEEKPYTNSIDMYSTGIVLFEMFSRPLPPGMERISTIKALKHTQRVPEGFGEAMGSIQCELAASLIARLVSCDAEQRPTAAALLKDDSLPLRAIDDHDFQQALSKAVRRRGGRAHRQLMSTLFEQEVNPASDYVYDHAVCQDRFKFCQDIDLQTVRRRMEEILSLHSFVPFSSHLLRPAKKGGASGGGAKACMLLDQSGLPVMLPSDLRSNFVRFCARNGVERMRRFAIDRVYAEKEINGGVHPLEQWECSVDCVGAAGERLAMAVNMLLLVVECGKKLCRDERVVLRIGDSRLLRAALRHLSLNEHQQTAAMTALAATASKSAPARLEALSAAIGGKDAGSLIALLDGEERMERLRGKCSAMVRSREPAVRDAAKAALADLDSVGEALGAVELHNVEVMWEGVAVYRPAQFSGGIVWRAAIEMRGRKGKLQRVVLMAGGDCSALLASSLHPSDPRPPMERAMLGCSVSINVLASLQQRIEEEEDEKSPGSQDVLLCSYGQPQLTTVARLATRLREFGLSVDVVDEPISNVEEYIQFCSDEEILDLLVVFDAMTVFVYHFNVTHGKMTIEAAIDLVSQYWEAPATRKTRTSLSLLAPAAGDARPSPAPGSHLMLDYAVVERLAFNTRKRVENQLGVHLKPFLSLLAPSTSVTAVINDLSRQMMGTVAGALSRSSTQEELAQLFDQLTKQHGKSKEELECVYDSLRRVLRGPSAVLVLYRMSDGWFKVIT